MSFLSPGGSKAKPKPVGKQTEATAKLKKLGGSKVSICRRSDGCSNNGGQNQNANQNTHQHQPTEDEVAVDRAAIPDDGLSPAYEAHVGNDEPPLYEEATGSNSGQHQDDEKKH
ncbi:unnamed protein product [Clonostachys byssicola]|uniref:Uncharacterized protein n=1 Tax=Clonostachys byssicola TaxID=160290 RepID=A0A9N9UP12_9HYPO|nr:unnamed protein product [Clonostachys byssicola]